MMTAFGLLESKSPLKKKKKLVFKYPLKKELIF